MSMINRSERIHAVVIRLLQEERERQGISMYQLAPKADLHQSTMSLIERDKRKPTLATLLRIAEVLGIELGNVLLQAADEVRADRDLSGGNEGAARASRAG